MFVAPRRGAGSLHGFLDESDLLFQQLQVGLERVDLAGDFADEAVSFLGGACEET